MRTHEHVKCRARGCLRGSRRRTFSRLCSDRQKALRGSPRSRREPPAPRLPRTAGTLWSSWYRGPLRACPWAAMANPSSALATNRDILRSFHAQVACKLREGKTSYRIDSMEFNLPSTLLSKCVLAKRLSGCISPRCPISMLCVTHLDCVSSMFCNNATRELCR